MEYKIYTSVLVDNISQDRLQDKLDRHLITPSIEPTSMAKGLLSFHVRVLSTEVEQVGNTHPMQEYPTLRVTSLLLVTLNAHDDCPYPLTMRGWKQYIKPCLIQYGLNNSVNAHTFHLRLVRRA